MPTTVKPQTLGSPWSSLLWYGPTRLPPSPLWTSLASRWLTPLTFSYWTHECTPGWPITHWGLCSVAYQGMFRWTPATVWERCRVTSHWQVRIGEDNGKANSYWCRDHYVLVVGAAEAGACYQSSHLILIKKVKTMLFEPFNTLSNSVLRVPAVSCGGAHAGNSDWGSYGLHGSSHPQSDSTLPYAKKQDQVLWWDECVCG